MSILFKALTLALSLHAGCSLGAVLLAQDKPTDAPLLPELLDKVPELYRARARTIRVAPEVQKRYLKPRYEPYILGLVVGRIAQTADGVSFLFDAVDKEPISAHRARILRTLSNADHTPEYLESHPDALKVYERYAATDPDAASAVQVLSSLRRIHINRLARLLQRRMEMAREAGDQATLEMLSEEESKRYKWFGEIAMPPIYRDAPPTFAVGANADALVRVLAFGDFGTGQESQTRNAATMRAYHEAHPFDFGITMGDNFYGAGMDSPSDPRWNTQFEDLYGPMGIKFYASLGNHDYGQTASPLSEILYSEKSQAWSMPARHYSFTAGAAQFFQIDTVDFSERQARWLGEELAESTATWKIVYGHYQIYSATRGDNDDQQSDLVHRLLPILKRHQVDLYICGHDHNLQILKPDEGVNFVVAGGGGAGTYELDDDYARSEFKAQSHGFAVIEVDRDSLDVRLIDISGKELRVLPIKKAMGVAQDARHVRVP